MKVSYIDYMQNSVHVDVESCIEISVEQNPTLTPSLPSSLSTTIGTLAQVILAGPSSLSVLFLLHILLPSFLLFPSLPPSPPPLL